MSPMHYAAAERLVAEHRTAHEAAAARSRLRRLFSRRQPAEPASPAAAADLVVAPGPSASPSPTPTPSPVAMTLASYRLDKDEAAKPRERTVA